MTEKWLQIRGDPAVRNFLFQQSRVESLFDSDIPRLHEVVWALLVHKGVFHAKIHYSSNQLTAWFADDPFRYRVFVREEVLEPGFLDQFPDQPLDLLQPLVDDEDTRAVLTEFARLRSTDTNIYLRNGSINRINGLVGMTFSCDGTHYLDHDTFLHTLDLFGKVCI